MRGAVLIAIVSAGLACTPIDREPKIQRGPVADVAAASRVPGEPQVGRVITVLQTRDHEVTVFAGDDGLRFTVNASGGDVLASLLTEPDFARLFPVLYRRYDSAFAGEDLEGVIDASLSHVERPEPAPR